MLEIYRPHCSNHEFQFSHASERTGGCWRLFLREDEKDPTRKEAVSHYGYSEQENCSACYIMPTYYTVYSCYSTTLKAGCS